MKHGSKKTIAQMREKGSFFEGLLSFFFPPSCVICRKCGVRCLCPECLAELEAVFDPVRFLVFGGNGFADEMTALFPYGNGAVRKLIFAYKNDKFRENEEIFRFFLKKAIRKKALRSGIDLVTYAPRRPAARRRAGFDQAEEMARIAAEETGVPLECLLLRTGHNRKQRKLSRESRRKNVQGAFVSVRPLHGETVLLVDDVVTSGATVWECARILKKAGAQKVFVLSYARSGGKAVGGG